MKIFKLGLVYLIALAIASIAVGSIMLPKASAAGTTKTTPPKEPTTPITLRKAGGTQQEFTSGNPNGGLPGRTPIVKPATQTAAPQKTTGAGKAAFNPFSITRKIDR
jgi:hypothetical protein